jgi:hypothetical protein
MGMDPRHWHRCTDRLFGYRQLQRRRQQHCEYGKQQRAERYEQFAATHTAKHHRLRCATRATRPNKTRWLKSGYYSLGHTVHRVVALFFYFLTDPWCSPMTATKANTEQRGSRWNFRITLTSSCHREHAARCDVRLSRPARHQATARSHDADGSIIRYGQSVRCRFWIARGTFF